MVVGFLVFLSLASGSFADDQKIVFGVAPGPYGDLIKLAIAPGLEKKHYTVEVTEFSDYVQPDLALANKSIDVNLFQHHVYLDKFSADHGLKLSPVITVPTASLGVYSKRFKSVADIKDGATVTIANDPTNLARALRFLQALGLIKISPDIDPSKASEKDIAENPKHLNIQPVEAAQLPRTLDSVDYSLVNGNYAIASGIWPTALAREVLTEGYINLIAVRTEDLDKPFVKDIVAVVKSKAFLDAVNDPKNGFALFQKPQWLKDQGK
ncbi:MAG: MetQ/NlpA family ABC transporter substrate-binding protein [Candidatus Baltobacteraceae bacterium]|jgi:D-methionine transport system substrate-binding protein